jgi:hypothetical protein
MGKQELTPHERAMAHRLWALLIGPSHIEHFEATIEEFRAAPKPVRDAIYSACTLDMAKRPNLKVDNPFR